LSFVKSIIGVADGVEIPESNIGNLEMGRDYWHFRSQRAGHVEKVYMRTWEIFISLKIYFCKRE
jgi:hypothetical protein